MNKNYLLIIIYICTSSALFSFGSNRYNGTQTQRVEHVTVDPTRELRQGIQNALNWKNANRLYSLLLQAQTEDFFKQILSIQDSYGNGKTMLSLAIEADHTPLFNMLISNNVPTNVHDASGNTLLHNAFEYNRTAMAIQLLDKNRQQINSKNNDLQTPLHFAAKYANKNLLSRLLSLQTEINAVDNQGNTPLFYAIKHNNLEAFETLSESHANLFIKNFNNQTVLHYAAYYGTVQILEQVIKKGLSMHDIDKEGNQPLHLACSGKQEKNIFFLTKRGSAINHKNKFDQLPLHLAIKNRNDQNAILFFIENGSLQDADIEGNSPLHYAAIQNNTQTILDLINAEASLNKQNKHGFSALHIAADNNYQTLFDLLIKHDIDQNLISIYAETAKDILNRKWHDNAMKILAKSIIVGITCSVIAGAISGYIAGSFIEV
ncbi:ankyrin repeat domain-containing protein [Candidatus Babeliales bacterium]|nr:ankyrin repeat domain-containing protein [Candidatus Babeliales bacterium]